MNGYFHSLEPEVYLINVDATNNVCIIGIVSSGGTMFLLGDTYLRNYYTVFDDDNSQIAFLPTL